MGIFTSVLEWIQGLLSIIPKLVYFLTASFVSVLDVFQFAVRKIAGLDAYYLSGSTEAQTGDIALSFIRGMFDENTQFPALKNAFWSLVILGVIMLLLSTFIATIRSEYSGGDNNKYNVIASAVKSMFLFLIVPVSVIFGLTLGDVFLLGLDRATSTNEGASTLFATSGVHEKLESTRIDRTDTVTYTYYDIFGSAIPANSQPISGVVFQSAAFNANRARQGQKIGNNDFASHLRNNTLTNFGIFVDGTDEEIAQMIDEAFASNIVFSSDNKDTNLKLGPMRNLAGTGPFSLNEGRQISNMSKFNVALVWYFYDLWLYNYIIAFAFLIVVMKILVDVVAGLMKRLIELVILFMVSPPIIAIMPMDGGKAFEKWRENFISRAISAFAVIAGFNIFFLILPYIQQINFLDPNYLPYKFVNLLISTLFVIVGLQSIQSIMSILNNIIGGDDAAKAGGELIGKAQDLAKGAATFTATAAGASVAAIKGAGKLAGKGAMAVGKGLGRSAKMKADALDKRYTGGAVGKFMKDTADKIKGVANSALFLGKGKDIKDAENEATGEWEGKVGNEKYDEKMKSSDVYNNYLRNVYNNKKRGKGSPSFEEWSKKATNAHKGAENAFAKSINQTRQQFISDTSKDSERSKFVGGRVDRTKRRILTSRKQSVSKAYNTAKKSIKSISGGAKKMIASGYKQSGLKNLVNTTGMVGKTVESAVIRGGKGGFKAVQLGFQGKTFKEMAQAKKEKDFKKEEGLRVEVRKQIEKEDEELKKKGKK